MKTWEMIKELTENPTKKFCRADLKDAYVTVVGGIIVWQGEHQEGQKFAVSFIEPDNWEEFKESMSFMEAVEEITSGWEFIKVVHPCIDIEEYDFYEDYNDLSDLLWRLGNDYDGTQIKRILMEGKFYVE